MAEQVKFHYPQPAMTDATHPSANIAAILQWLASPADGDPSQELEALEQHLADLAHTGINATQQQEILELLHLRAQAAINTLRPRLANITLPIPADARYAARVAKAALERLAATLLQAARDNPAATQTLHLQALQALHNHLLISALVASPAGVGVWRQMHAIYAAALTNGNGRNDDDPLCKIYFHSQLLASTQPASLAAHELTLVDAAITAIAVLPERPNSPNSGHSGLFWIDPNQDQPATAASRKSPPHNLAVWWFACDRPAAALTTIIDAIEEGQNPAIFALPAFAGTTSGLATLKRVVRCWDSPAKRRFNRRRQNIRASLLAGMDAVHELLRNGRGVSSEWLITNESPDGCAAMHVAGPTGRIDIGDVVALRFTGESNWQICIARWAQSENPEHIELGLQRLAPEAAAATLVATDLRAKAILFHQPGQQQHPTLMLSTGALSKTPNKAVLLTERNNLDVRETRPGPCLERTTSVECYLLVH